ncbi:hypothetical protein L249_3379 [Ophiocordyceps polyrhachis-furcata BCC 54312]|uniref:Glutaredoxin-like protein n=1 Tax=Ophiocordyceps polyrhachis-furcata BCC 54312 TaxID=1330021 RepID=A0A367LMH4_9HYPO|nr:hypothetical protein L249_3379 [Ophiocordyceps polyrhachis-furcata BCC 54312]
MFSSRRLLQACRITLFSRKDCGLCVEAGAALSEVAERRPFVYTKVDLARPESKPWRKLYGYDIPVLAAPCDVNGQRKIHISKASAQAEEAAAAGEAVKLMHRFTPAEIEAKMDEVEAS